MFIHFADMSRPGGRAAMPYVVAFPEMLTAAATDLASIGSALSADGKGGLVCCQDVRRRGGRQMMANESD
jgi:PE family